MSRRTYSADQIAAYFLSITDPEDNDVSNLKLQKLCYYAQGLCTAMRGAPLFSDRIEAWDHGPVVPNLYHKFKGHAADPIPAPPDFDRDEIEPADREALNDIYEFYGQYSAWRLRNMTHDEKPWADAYKTAHREIRVDALAEFFKNELNDEYVGKVYGERGAEQES